MMATVNYIPYQRQSAVSLGKVAGYVSQDEKTQDRRTGRKLVSGVRCSSHFAVQEFRAARVAHHKKSPVWFYHYTQSFSPKEPITGPQAPPAGERICGTGLAGEPGTGGHPCGRPPHPFPFSGECGVL